MKKIAMGLCMLAALPAAAQETYEDANLVTGDLNGTARYVGMGGAMEALGADISTISTNPAGIALFRKSQVSLSGGFTAQQDAKDFNNASKAHANFDQIGLVWAKFVDEKSSVNLAFNYHKSRDFNYILSAAQDRLDRPASQNALSYIKAIGDRRSDGVSDFSVNSERGNYYGDFYWTSQLDNLYYNTFILDQDAVPGYNLADGYDMKRASKGYIGEYEFNISGNIKDRVYLGMTFGYQDVHYRGYSEYTENLNGEVGQTGAYGPIGSVTVSDRRKITGWGYNFKLGAIFRPIEDSPFRIGLSFASPTFYDLTTSNYTYLLNNSSSPAAWNERYVAYDDYDFRLNSPMKFGVSLGHTVGNYLALGASYEYADYGATDPRIKDGEYYDWYMDDYYSSSSRDHAMKDHTENTLKGVSTLKLGAEYKPVPEVAFRAGYNYVSPMYKSSGFKDGFIESYGTNVASATDYTNWKSTNRLTLGVGYSHKNFFADLAYQYSTQKGDFYPFMDAYADDYYGAGDNDYDKIDNYATKTEVENNRHQLIVTLGYKF